MHCKKKDQQDGKPEVGYGHAHLRGGHQPDIAGAIVVGRGIYADGQRQHRGHGHCHHRQRYGQRQALEHQFQHRGAVDIAVTQVASQHASDPGSVALKGRVIQPQLAGQCLDGFGRGVGPHQNLRGVARQDLEYPEDDHGRRQQGGDQREQALQQEEGHVRWESSGPRDRGGRTDRKAIIRASGGSVPPAAF